MENLEYLKKDKYDDYIIDKYRSLQQSNSSLGNSSQDNN